ncbi:hypothetical protein [Hyphomicrobium sp.]|uniref:hypothetical protein n=1 Tax=Hyphomicrobium sp. TaxID=82 RepID=UPI00356AD9B3
MESSVRGIERVSRARFGEAARCWLEADAALPIGGREFDPLSAASRSNAGAARLLLGHEHEAEQCFDAAERSWQKVIAAIATLDVPMTGASSSFHLRLAATVPEALINARRERYRRLAESALAIVQFNRALVDMQNSAPETVARLAVALRVTLAEVLGATSPEARQLSLSAGSAGGAGILAIYADKLAEISTRRQTFAAALSEECAQLESAVTLTVLLGPQMINSAGFLGKDQTNTSASSRHQLEFE